MDQDNKVRTDDNPTAPLSVPRPDSVSSGEAASIRSGVETATAGGARGATAGDPANISARAASPPINPSEPAADLPTSLFVEIKGWVPDLFFAALIALFIVFFVVHPVRVEGVSMQPQLIDQERIFVNRFIYHLTEIHRGDIVVFFYPKDTNKSFIKRIIGLPGDLVEIKAGVIYINGKKLEEPYLDPKYLDYESFPSKKVRDGCYYVLGDHRNQSNDSRHWDLVPRENIYGKAMFRYWPVSRLGTLE